MSVRANVRADVWDRSGGKCAYCGGELHPLRNFTVDHVVPVSAGGSGVAAVLATPAA